MFHIHDSHILNFNKIQEYKDTKTFKNPNFESLILKKLDILKESFYFQISNLSGTGAI